LIRPVADVAIGQAAARGEVPGKGCSANALVRI